MLHEPLTFTGSQKSLSQHTQVQQHHINITAWPAAALAPALGAALQPPAPCHASQMGRALLPKWASLCAQRSCAADANQVMLRAHCQLCTSPSDGVFALDAKKKLGLLDLKLQGFPFHVQHTTFFLKNCTFEPKKMDRITDRQISRKLIESRWHICSSEDTKQCTSWQDSSRIKNRDSKMHSKT